MSNSLVEVLHGAEMGLFAGQYDDDAVHEAIKRGFVFKYYEGAAAIVGLAKLGLTPRGKSALYGDQSWAKG